MMMPIKLAKNKPIKEAKKLLKKIKLPRRLSSDSSSRDDGRLGSGSSRGSSSSSRSTEEAVNASNNNDDRRPMPVVMMTSEDDRNDVISKDVAVAAYDDNITTTSPHLKPIIRPSSYATVAADHPNNSNPGGQTNNNNKERTSGVRFSSSIPEETNDDPRDEKFDPFASEMKDRRRQQQTNNDNNRRALMKKARGLSVVSSKYDINGDGRLDKFEKLARSLDKLDQGSISPEIVIQLLREQDALQKRQWLLLFGNIIQWLPIIVGAVYTFFKFSERQYQQNVGGRILTSLDYVRGGIVTSDEIQSLWNLSDAAPYPLTDQQRADYDRDGFVVIPNFLTASEADTLDKVVTHNLNEMAFPDLLTKCSRKFHGEHYHSTVTHRFWQQPRISDLLSVLGLDGDVPYMVTSEILEMPSGAPCIPQWHWDFLTFPQNYNASYTTGTQIWWSSEEVDSNVGGGLAFLPGSHKWANSVDEGAALHPCFAMNLFDKMSTECTQLLDREMVVPKLTPKDIVVFSRFTLHRSVARNPSVPFKSPTGRRGYTLRVGSARSIFKQDTMQCFPSHPSSNFERQLKQGKRYDSVIDQQTGLPSPHAIYRPMNVRDSEELMIREGNGRKMSTTTFLHYSAQSVIRQKIKWKLAKAVEDAVNGMARRQLLDISCKAMPTPDVIPWD